MPLNKDGTPQPSIVNNKKFLDNYDNIFGIKCPKCGHRFKPEKEELICIDCAEKQSGQDSLHFIK